METKRKAPGGIPRRAKFKRQKKHASLFYSSGIVKGFFVACDQNREDRATAQIMDLLHFVSV